MVLKYKFNSILNMRITTFIAIVMSSFSRPDTDSVLGVAYEYLNQKSVSLLTALARGI